jgi:hypothetical protein
LQRGRAGSRATRGKGPGEFSSFVRPTDNQSKGGWRRGRSGKREDDANGKWNYEVIVRSQGKEWGFEVDPKEKLFKTHGEKK